MATRTLQENPELGMVVTTSCSRRWVAAAPTLVLLQPAEHIVQEETQPMVVRPKLQPTTRATNMTPSAPGCRVSTLTRGRVLLRTQAGSLRGTDLANHHTMGVPHRRRRLSLEVEPPGQAALRGTAASPRRCDNLTRGPRRHLRPDDRTEPRPPLVRDPESSVRKIA